MLHKNTHISVGIFRTMGWLFDHNKDETCFLSKEVPLRLARSFINIQHDKYLFQNLLKSHDFFHINLESESGAQGLRRKLIRPLFFDEINL